MAQRVIRDLADPEFGRLFTDVRRRGFGWRRSSATTSPYERDDFAAFLRGEPIDDRRPGPWQAMIREHVAAGRELARVHVIEEPLSDYIRYELAAYRRTSTPARTCA